MEHWLEREIAQWVHPMKDRSDDPSHHEQTLLPRSSSTKMGYNSSQQVINITLDCHPRDNTPTPNDDTSVSPSVSLDNALILILFSTKMQNM